jgi:hypothetical protein
MNIHKIANISVDVGNVSDAEQTDIACERCPHRGAFNNDFHDKSRSVYSGGSMPMECCDRSFLYLIIPTVMYHRGVEHTAVHF